jgi:hypothetical protein
MTPGRGGSGWWGSGFVVFGGLVGLAAIAEVAGKLAVRGEPKRRRIGFMLAR